jgi:hypothetical protein
VWQRATTYALTGTFAYGSADRWAFAMGATAAGTASQVASGLTGFQYALKLSRNSGSTSTGFIYADQVVENANTYDLQGQTVTVSFWARAGANYSAAGSVLGLTVNTGAGSVDSTSLTATFGGWTGNAVPYNNNITITTTWTRYSVTFAVGSTITNIGLLFTFPPSGTAGADDAVYITGVQLEKGATATSFDYRPFGTELALCQRYLPAYSYNSSGTAGYEQIGSGYWTSSTSTYIFVPHPVNTRVPPTGLVSDGASNFLNLYTSNLQTTGLIWTATAGVRGSLITATATGGGAGGGVILITKNTGGLLYFTGCEL